jgi:GAF domain-containing protein
MSGYTSSTSSTSAPTPAALEPHKLAAGIDAIVRAYAGADSLHEAYTAIDAYAKPVLGHALCTVNRFDADTMEVVRLYSSDPASYPTGGRKEKRGTAWGQRVLLDRQVYVGEGEDAIRVAFDDYDMILKLGLKSVINVPIVCKENCLGTLNILMTSPAVNADQISFANLLALLVMPALLQARQD